MLVKGNEFIEGGFFEPSLPIISIGPGNIYNYDPTYSIVEIPGDLVPDSRLHRYDPTNASKIRLATIQELNIYDSISKDNEADEFVKDKNLKALARVSWEELQKMTPKTGQVPLNWTNFKARYRTLLRQILDGVEP